MIESRPKRNANGQDPISQMLGSAAVGPLPPAGVAEVATRVKRKRVASRGEPDFQAMTPAEKVAWNLARWQRVLG
ncbi:MAG: hypothetical protein WD534_01510 [Phycisphaeraceae bacterium]